MEVHDDGARLFTEAVQQVVHRRERVVDLDGHESTALEADDERAVGHDCAAARGGLRIVERAQDRCLAIHVRHHVLVVPDVVAGGDDVDAGVEQLFGHLGRDAETGGGVLAVANDEINLVFIPEAGQVFLNGLPAGPSNDVADHQDAHGLAVRLPIARTPRRGSRG